MKRNKRYWTFTEKQKRHDHITKREKAPKWYLRKHTIKEAGELKPFFDENYIHPTRTHKNRGVWEWW